MYDTPPVAVEICRTKSTYVCRCSLHRSIGPSSNHPSIIPSCNTIQRNAISYRVQSQVVRSLQSMTSRRDLRIQPPILLVQYSNFNPLTLRPIASNRIDVPSPIHRRPLQPRQCPLTQSERKNRVPRRRLEVHL